MKTAEKYSQKLSIIIYLVEKAWGGNHELMPVSTSITAAKRLSTLPTLALSATMLTAMEAW